MTNEEAIKKLKEQQAEFNDTYVDFAGVNEAYNLAIKALENERPKGEWINRHFEHADCSICGRRNAYHGDFCMHCGADMRR